MMKTWHITKNIIAMSAAVVACGFASDAFAMSNQNFTNENLISQNYASKSSLKRKRQPVADYQQRRLRKTQQQPFSAPLNSNTFGNQPSQAIRPSGSGIRGSGTVVVPNR